MGLLFNPAETLKKGLFALQENKSRLFSENSLFKLFVLNSIHGKPIFKKVNTLRESGRRKNITNKNLWKIKVSYFLKTVY